MTKQTMKGVTTRTVNRVASRASKAAAGAQRAQSYAIRQAAKTKRVAVNKAGETIKAAGQAISNVTTPYIAQRAASKMSEERTARERVKTNTGSAAIALEEWKRLMDGNPNPDTGASGQSQSGSTSVLD